MYPNFFELNVENRESARPLLPKVLLQLVNDAKQKPKLFDSSLVQGP